MKIITIGVMCIVVGLVYHYQNGMSRHEKNVNELWETHNASFKVRVTAYAEENGGFVAGATYVFQSAAVGTSDWRDVMKFPHDDPVPIPRDQVRSVNDQVGYVFMGWMYAVTIDRGATWSVWNAEKDLPGWRCCNYRLIQEISIEPDGNGSMKLRPIPGRPGELPELRTRDYGKQWSP